MSLPETLTREQQQVLDDCELRIRALGRLTVEALIRIGEQLERAKQAVRHGFFVTWLTERLGWELRTAQRYMMVWEAFKNDNLSCLDMIDPSALYLLAAPSTSSDVRNQALRRASRGERVTHAAVKAALDGEEPLEPPLPWIKPLAIGLRSLAGIEHSAIAMAVAIEPPLRLAFAERCRESAAFLDELDRELRHVAG